LPAGQMLAGGLPFLRTTNVTSTGFGLSARRWRGRCGSPPGLRHFPLAAL